MADLDELLGRLAELMAQVEALPEPARGQVLELLDGVDALHRVALTQLEAALGLEVVADLRRAHPALRWLLDAYGVGLDERDAVEQALSSVRPYLHSHGGDLEVLEVRGGVVRVRMSGACAGCTASAITLREGVVAALEERYEGFVALDVVEDLAPPHPPPGPTLVQLSARPK